MVFDAGRPDFLKAKNGVGFSPLFYQNVENKSLFFLPLNCAWATADVPIGIYLEPLPNPKGVFARTFTSELAKNDLRDKSLSKTWTLLGRRDIIIRQIEYVEATGANSPRVLTLKYPEQMQFRSLVNDIEVRISKAW
jgi:hypothetical protein